jgi:hypothetical protein
MPTSTTGSKDRTMATVTVSIASFMKEFATTRGLPASSTPEALAATIRAVAVNADLTEVAEAVDRHLQTGADQEVRLRHEELLNLEAALPPPLTQHSPAPARPHVYLDVTGGDWKVYKVQVTPRGFACGVCHQPMQLQFAGSLHCQNCLVIGCDACVDALQVERGGRKVTVLQCRACHADEVGDF